MARSNVAWAGRRYTETVPVTQQQRRYVSSTFGARQGYNTLANNMVQVDVEILRKKAVLKLYDIRSRDIEQHGRCDLTVEDILALVEESTDHCPGCNCRMDFGDYKRFCRYQWSPDRINRNVPHSKQNVRIVCWSCNIGGLGIRKGPCKNGCHPGDLPWGSAPVPAPNPEDVPLPTFTGHRPRRCLAVCGSGDPPSKRLCLGETENPVSAPAANCVEGLLEG